METGPERNGTGITTTNGAQQKAPIANDTQPAGPFDLIAQRRFRLFEVDHPDAPICRGVRTKEHDPARCPPDQRGKHPVPAHWSEESSADPKVLAAITAARTVNLGIDCGASGLLVIDQDTPDGLRKYAASIGQEVPETFEVMTHADRSHLYFQQPPGITIGNPAALKRPAGCDVRGKGGYVVGAGSKHASGEEYTAVDSAAPIAPAPQWLITLLTAPPVVGTVNGESSWGFDPTEVIRGPQVDQPGERHDRIMRYASALRARAMPEREATLLIEAMWGRCEQPPNCRTPMTLAEAEGIRADVYRRYQAGPTERARMSIAAQLDRDLTARCIDRGESPNVFQTAVTAWDLAGQGHRALDPDADHPDVVRAAQSVGRRMVLTKASEIKPRRVRWLWRNRLALGTLGLLAGREGLGKSSIGYSIAAEITRGLLPGEYFGAPRDVLVCASEDSWEFTIVPRLIAAGAALERVHRVEVLAADDIHVGLSLPRDLRAVEEAVHRTGAVLLLLDPLMSRLENNLDTHRDGDVRRALEPMVAVADRTGMSVLGLIHHNKSGSADPLQLVMGSKAFTAVARSVHTVVPDPDDESDQRRLFGTPKNNLGRLDLPTLAFTITGHQLETDDGPTWTSRVVWGEEIGYSINETMRRASDSADDRSAASEAAEWLVDYLEQQGGRASSVDIRTEGAKAGHNYNSLKRAKRNLHIGHDSEGFPRCTVWKTAGEAQ